MQQLKTNVLKMAHAIGKAAVKSRSQRVKVVAMDQQDLTVVAARRMSHVPSATVLAHQVGRAKMRVVEVTVVAVLPSVVKIVGLPRLDLVATIAKPVPTWARVSVGLTLVVVAVGSTAPAVAVLEVTSLEGRSSPLQVVVLALRSAIVVLPMVR